MGSFSKAFGAGFTTKGSGGRGKKGWGESRPPRLVVGHASIEKWYVVDVYESLVGVRSVIVVFGFTQPPGHQVPPSSSSPRGRS